MVSFSRWRSAFSLPLIKVVTILLVITFPCRLSIVFERGTCNASPPPLSLSFSLSYSFSCSFIFIYLPFRCLSGTPKVDATLTFSMVMNLSIEIEIQVSPMLLLRKAEAEIVINWNWRRQCNTRGHGEKKHRSEKFLTIIPRKVLRSIKKNISRAELKDIAASKASSTKSYKKDDKESRILIRIHGD